tara:strand:+ start:8275 stop:9249 length:975 start_codon:yes stop_codon:yes gene_type:complete
MAGILIGIGLGLSGVGMGASFLQAGKARRSAEKGERHAARMMDEARKKLEVNFVEALAINKLPYELEREALLVSGAQAIDAARESERGAAAGVGRVQLAQQKGQANVRSAESKELYSLDLAGAQEDSRLRDVGVQLDLGEVAGAQMSSADSRQAQAAATTQGFQQLASFGAQALQAAPLYAEGAGARAQARGQRQAVRTDKANYMKLDQAKKGFLGIGTGYNKFAPKTPSSVPMPGGASDAGAEFAGGKSYAQTNFLKGQYNDFTPSIVSQINKAGFNKEGELIGQNIDIESIKSMTAQEFEMFERGLSPGQRDLVNQALGLYK